MKYDACTDEELIERLRQGETEITDYILEKYKPLVRKYANAMYLIGGETDDLIQEGMIGLFKAVRDYDSGRDAGFYTFADLCVSRQMYAAIQAAGTGCVTSPMPRLIISASGVFSLKAFILRAIS